MFATIPAMRWSPLVFLLLTAAVDPVTIRQFRPSRVGDVFDLDVTAARRRHIELDVRGRPPAVADDDRSVHLVGRCTVTAVDAHGAYTAVRCRVDRLVTTVGGRDASPLPAGAVVEVTAGQPFRRVDGPLPDGVAGPLSLVLTAYPPGAPTADDLFPPGRPRNVGQSWPMNPAARGPDAGPPPDHVAGHATLVDRTLLNGRPAVHVSRVSDVDGPAPVPAQPPGVQTAHRNQLTETTATLPVDPADAAAELAVRDTVDHDLHGTTPDGVPFTEQTHVVTDTRSVRTPVSP